MNPHPISIEIKELEASYADKRHNYLLKNSKKYQNLSIKKQKDFYFKNKKKAYKYNLYMTKQRSLKAVSYLVYNEAALPFQDHETIFDFKNLHEYSKLSQKFQLEGHQEGISDEEKKLYISLLKKYQPSRLYIPGDWFRYIDERNHLIYMSLYSSVDYITTKVFEKIEDFVDDFIPSIFVLPHNEKLFVQYKSDLTQSEKLYTMNPLQELRACGKEEELEILKKIVYSGEIYEMLEDISSNEIEKFGDCTFIIEEDKPYDSHQEIIINNVTTAENIDFKCLFEGIKKYEQPSKIMTKSVEKIYKIILKEILSQYYKRVNTQK